MVNKYKLGLVLGSFIALLHLLWTVMIALFYTSMQNLLNWIVGLHLLEPAHMLTQASRSKGILLVIITFISGYLMGILFGALRNKFMKKAKVKSVITVKKPAAKAKRKR